MPAPAAEQGILNVYLRAIAAARQLIYVEDQFFRSTLITDAMIEALRANPSLAIVVITTRAKVNQLFAAGWARACFERIRRERPGFELYSLRVHDVDSRGRKVLEDVDSHAKLLLVDDVFLTVGSCNVNNRGFKFEGELDLAIVDPELVAGMRLELWRGYLGGDARLKGDIASDVAVWKEHAERNRRYDPASADGPPASLVFPFEPKKCWRLFGPDVF
jgi:phosphatidylserine/phosphatidylglycerophosphate/cardiolipin synthase-like enzyme